MTSRLIACVPDAARAHILAHPTQPAHEAAAALGVTARVVYHYRRALIHEGALRSRYGRAALPAVIEAVAESPSLRAAAAAAGLSAEGVRKRLARAGMWADDARRDRVYSATQALAILGLGRCGHAYRQLRAWADAGLLRLRRARTSGSRGVITAEALMAFLERPDCPLDPARIADPDWRAYAEAARAGRLRPVRPYDPHERTEGPPCAAGCGALVSRAGGTCRACAMRRNQRRRHATAD